MSESYDDDWREIEFTYEELEEAGYWDEDEPEDDV